jgi:hypothetical protein
LFRLCYSKEVNNTDPTLTSVSPEEQLRGEVLNRTLASLIAAEQSEINATERAITDAVGQHAMTVSFGSKPVKSFDREAAMRPAALHRINTEELRTRMTAIRVAVAAAAPEDLANPNHEFDPWKQEYVAKTTAGLIAQANITSPRKRERYAAMAAQVAGGEYDHSPLKPSTDFEGRAKLHRSLLNPASRLASFILDKI